MNYERRLEELRQRTASFCDGLIIRSSVNRRYFTGFLSSAGTLVVDRAGAFLIVDSRYIEAARQKVCCYDVLEERDLPHQLKGLLQDHAVSEAAFDSAAVPFDEALWLEEIIAPVRLIKDRRAGREILEMRKRKSPEELECLRQAQAITDEAFLACLNHIRSGVSEMDLRIFLGAELARRGSEKRNFSMIFTSGARTSLPHGDPAIHIIQDGDFVMMDMGAAVDGYSADMTRTVAVGHVTEEQRQVYETVLNAQILALNRICPAAACCEIDRLAREYIKSSPYGNGTFGHGLGHSLGLEIHEDPRFSPASREILAPGMVMTVEPGIYLTGRFGVRIEDMVVVTEQGMENLTHSPKELLILR